MSIRLIASVVIAALLLTGTASAVPPNSEYGAQTPQTTALLTAQEAQDIALQHAGLTADTVAGLRSEFDADERVPEWDIAWRSGDWEYDYSVDAETGAIRDWEKEYDPIRAKEPAATEPTPTELTPTEPVVTEPEPVEPAPTQPAATTLTAEEAQAIALQHAGLTADQVNGLRSEYDVDDGVSVYEIEFQCGRWEYEYEIHAETGAILDWEKDD